MKHSSNEKGFFNAQPVKALTACSFLAAIGLTIASAQQQATSEINSASTRAESTETPILCDLGSGIATQVVFPESSKVAKAQIQSQTQSATVTQLKWAGNHQGVFVVRYSNYKPLPLAFSRYDASTQKFGPLQDVTAVFGNAGVSYDIRPASSEFDCSQDEKTIVYKDEQGLKAIDLKTGKEHLVAAAKDYPKGFNFLALSPDGKRVAFSQESQQSIDPKLSALPLYQNLWVMNVDGSHARKMGYGMSPSWSPDGRHLLAIIGSYNGGNRLERYDVETAKHQTLITRSMRALDSVAYSPDGKHIAVFGAYNPKKSNAQGVFLVDAQGQFLQTVATASQFMRDGVPPAHPVRIDW